MNILADAGFIQTSKKRANSPLEAVLGLGSRRNGTTSTIDKELSSMLEDTGEHITEDYLDLFFEIFEDLNIGDDYPPVPLEILEGIAIAFANASGYRVVLQAPILEPVEDEPKKYRTIGHQEVLAADPSHPKADVLKA